MLGNRVTDAWGWYYQVLVICLLCSIGDWGKPNALLLIEENVRSYSEKVTYLYVGQNQRPTETIAEARGMRIRIKQIINKNS